MDSTVKIWNEIGQCMKSLRMESAAWSIQIIDGYLFLG